jgi:chromosome segregation ATPase
MRLFDYIPIPFCTLKAMRKGFFQFSVEENVLHAFFSSAEERFKRYDVLTIKQNERIQNLTDEITLLKRAGDRPERRPELEGHLSELRAALGRVDGQFATRARVWDEFEHQLRDLYQRFQGELESVWRKLDERLKCDVRRLREDLHQYVGEQLAQSRALADSHRKSVDAAYNNLSERLSADAGQLLEARGREAELSLKIASLTSEMALRTDQNDRLWAALRADVDALNALDRSQRPAGGAVRAREIDLSSLEPRPTPAIDSSSPPCLPKFATVL